MIWLAGLASAGVVYLTKETLPLRYDDTCRAEAYGDGALFPPGMPAISEEVLLDCGATVTQVMVPVPPIGSESFQKVYLIVDPASLSDEPSRAHFKRGTPAFVFGDSNIHGAIASTAIPLERRWIEPSRLARGEQVELAWTGARYTTWHVKKGKVVKRWAEPGRISVVLTADGGYYAVGAGRVRASDPLDGRGRSLVDRWQAGRKEHAPDTGIPDISPAAELLTAPKIEQGRAYLFWISPFSLSDAEHGGTFMDPIGQLHARDCETRGSGGTCGRYWLDYSAFGAWWPDRLTQVVVLADGTHTVGGAIVPRLRVVVQEPYSPKLLVSPAWAPR